MKILILSDAWAPQINGVVRTLEATVEELTRQGHIVQILSPDPSRWASFSVPSYPEIVVEFFAHRRIAACLDSFQPDYVHIAVEGPLGWAARRVFLWRDRPFTTAFHTSFPDYMARRVPDFLACLRPLIRAIIWAGLRHFHAPSNAVMVATRSIEQDLHRHKIRTTALWGRGVDVARFSPNQPPPAAYQDLPRPLWLSVGRVSVEKGLADFLSLPLPGTKIIVGDGPARIDLQKRFPSALFCGAQEGAALAGFYAGADIFVFPSKTDTFGLVIAEALASGLPVAAYPVPGPADIFVGTDARHVGCLSHDLEKACLQALSLSGDSGTPALCQAFAARHFSWPACTAQFLAALRIPKAPAARVWGTGWIKTLLNFKKP
jgi:glycosyltransferase involved in cell wall biosynthesis